ncbi:MAG: single-stranded-DNA-specific exonuclease RecJ [Treponema sp.]|jgi:single-stranded-DNA-specific exonuclease|nr:single-stranded-DNA-specific exonuclease RecJ [Treponema sp.]
MKWEKKDISPELVKETAARYGCDLLTASILVRRNLNGAGEARYFLEDNLRHLHNPFDLAGMEDAVERIIAAKEEGEKVLVFGDRDVDGITGTVLLTGFLRDLGMDVDWRIPVGEESYGLSAAAVEEFAAAGTLIITVDNGISCHGEIRRAGELSVDVIVTDHHNPPEELPDAFCTINPKLKNSGYPFQGLSGCAVACKLVEALRFALKSELYGQPICLLNTRPANDAWIIEIARTRNLAVIDTLTETIVPGMVGITGTRIPAFLEGQQIFVWDAPLQRRIFAKLFGSGVEVGMLDIAGETGKEIPQAAGKSLLRLRELSTIARYSEKDVTELDVLLNLFVSFVRRREGLSGAAGRELQLAALGTVADIMPLRNENRILVRRGLASLREKPEPGLSELLFKLNLAGRFETRDVSWQLCPAIRSTGRMGKPQTAAALLLERDGGRRDRLADEIIAMNNERKKIEEEVWSFAEPMAFKNLPAYGEKLAFAWGEEIFRGVTGLIAQRLTRKFNVPALVVSFDGPIATGSLRSVRGYNLHNILNLCADIFINAGGHDFAAGFSMELAKWEVFLDRIADAVSAMELADEEDKHIAIDAELPPDYLTPEILKLTDRFEPYGEENGPLNFLSRNLLVREIGFMGKNEAKHVKLTLDTGKYKWPAVYWQAADKVKEEFDLNERVDIVFNAVRNYFNGAETPQLVIADLKRSER